MFRTTEGPHMPPDWMTVKEAAGELGLDVWTIRDRIRRGEIDATKIGKGLTSPYRIDRAYWAEYMESLKASA